MKSLICDLCGNTLTPHDVGDPSISKEAFVARARELGWTGSMGGVHSESDKCPGCQPTQEPATTLSWD